jgi:hypothetical protein
LIWVHELEKEIKKFTVHLKTLRRGKELYASNVEIAQCGEH